MKKCLNHVLTGFVLIVLALAFLNGCAESTVNVPKDPAPFFVTLPDFAPTPDGMAIDAEGNLVVACPNYGSYAEGATKPSVPACFIKVDKSGKVTKWFDCPIFEETGRACPMGIAFGPKGELYVSDNQNWPTGNGDDGEVNQGRILRIEINGAQVTTKVVVKGMCHPNGIRYRNGKLYVTGSMLPKVKNEDKLLVSAVYCFPADAENITLANTLDDPHIIATFPTKNTFCQYGLDGLVFDSKGHLFVGNFGDGTLHKLTLDESGKVTENVLFARTDHDYTLNPEDEGFLAKAVKAKMRTTDGICVDGKDNIYVADFSNNAVVKVSPAGEISVIAQNGDTNGEKGLLDQPGEPIVWNGRLMVTCFDKVTGPDKVNKGHDTPHTITSVAIE